MKKQQLRWIFGLTILASLSLVGLQGYIWQQGIQQEKAQFSRYIQHAVLEAAEEYLRPNESLILVDESRMDDSLRINAPGFVMIQIGEVDTSIIEPFPDLVESLVTAASKVSGQVTVRDNTQNLHVEITDSLFAFNTDSLFALKKEALPDSIKSVFIARHQQFCPTCEPGFSHLSVGDFKPILDQELNRFGINTDFQWAMQHRDNWLIVEGDTAKLEASNWKVPFFSFRADRNELVDMLRQPPHPQQSMHSSSAPLVYLYFPNEHWYLLQSMGPTLLISSLLAFLVIGCIGYAIFVILHQKQLSEIKTDFINNMTHEFKTPISTIALACEAMKDDQVELPESSRAHYLNMIASENDRLGTQVEKVLQMALLDKKDLGLNVESVNIHNLLQEIIDAFSLQLEQRCGSISTSLLAQQNIVEGDAMHLRQMFTNLLDNANKYSPESPDILVETRNKKHGIEIAVHDKGMGINRDALRKIFDRFYRVPTGNLHDVKGFGLGLSYVQTMAMAHGGHVYAKSKPGLGSTFYLFLPNPNA